MIYQIGKNDTIAEVLTANGVDVELSCEQGMCGACLTKSIIGGSRASRYRTVGRGKGTQ